MKSDYDSDSDIDHKTITGSENGQILEKYKIKDNNVKFARIEKDKSDRATVENAIDPKTYQRLMKFIKNGTLTNIDGCLSTGKEANIYYGYNTDTNKEYAIKVYKTSVLVFKDRERYISGEYRFKSFAKNNKINARKLIKVWSEKEFRNLKRLKLNGFNVPEPFDLKSNILLMEFLSKESESGSTDNKGEKNVVDNAETSVVHDDIPDDGSTINLASGKNSERGWPSPKLKDYEFQSIEEVYQIYYQILINMRLMYHKCRLIHADLSEYNLIMYRGEIYIIDVSQSIEPTHPMALDFLRMDIKNINDYFDKKKNLNIFLERDIFKFVIEDFDVVVKSFVDKSSVTQDDIPSLADGLTKLDLVLNKDKHQYDSEFYLLDIIPNLKVKLTEEDEKEDEIFRGLYLIRDLNSLEENDFIKFKEGNIDILKELVVDGGDSNLVLNSTEEVGSSDEYADTDEESEDEDFDNSDSSDLKNDEEELHDFKKTSTLKKFENKDEKKLRKKLVKEEKQEKRKTKMKKHIKHKLVKKSAKK